MDESWLALDTSKANEIVVKHLEDFVSLTIKGFLLTASIAVAAVSENGQVEILGKTFDSATAAPLVSVLFLATFAAIAVHGLNVLFASSYLSSSKTEAKSWYLDVFLKPGILSPLACWPGRFGSLCSAVSYGFPFLLWWGMDTVQARFHAEQSYMMWRYAFIALGVAVGWIMGFSYVRLYIKLRDLRDLQRYVGTVGILKLVAATLFTWIGYTAYLADRGGWPSLPEAVDVVLAYPFAYTLPAWALMSLRVVVGFSVLVLLGGAWAFLADAESSAWPAALIGATGLSFAGWKCFPSNARSRVAPKGAR